VTYRWRYEDRRGTAVPGPDLRFTEQSEAEDWLGANWQALLHGGVDQVTLLDGEDEVYGPMSLHPPAE
jgi:hypothetical protein